MGRVDLVESRFVGMKSRGELRDGVMCAGVCCRVRRDVPVQHASLVALKMSSNLVSGLIWVL